MIQPHTSNLHALGIALGARVSLSTEQASALTTELAKPEYAGLSTVQCVARLHDPTATTVQVRYDATWPETKRWLMEYQRLLLTDRTDLSSGIRQKWQVKIPVVLAAYPDDYTYNADTAPTFAAVATEAITDGVATQAEVDEFRARWWRTMYCSPASQIVGEDFFIEEADVEACR